MVVLDPDKKPARIGPISALHHWFMRRVASGSFQSWAAGFPLTRRAARKDGERLFDLVSGFAYSQTLLAVVELKLLEKLQSGPKTAQQIAASCGIDIRQTELLCKAAAALDLIGLNRDGSYRLARLGAATLGVPGLRAMIKHHAVFYRDLEDPVALLRGETKPELAEFWPYVRGETAQTIAPDIAATYSDLMAQSQSLVGDETLRIVNLRDTNRLMDVGGGTGAFAKAVRAKYPDISVSVFDLPPVIAAGEAALARSGITGLGGSFHDPLPAGADTISLIRVLYDHDDKTVTALLRNIFDTLPNGGRLIISEPMSGGDSPTRAGDVYFALYTLAMTTGKARSAQQIETLLRLAGFENVQSHQSYRPFVTNCVTARKSL